MYFPLLRGKQYDLMAVRELAPQFAERSLIVPIIEPVKVNSTTRLSLDHYVQANMRFILVVNPLVGDVVGNTAVIDRDLIQSTLDEYENFVPALYYTPATDERQLQRLVENYDGRTVAVIYASQPGEGGVLDRLIGHEAIEYHIFLDGRVSQEFPTRFPRSKRVFIRDRFSRTARNADYPDDEFFSDSHRYVPNDEYVGFGDYSVAGSSYSDEGGPAYAVALHHVYRNDSSRGDLYIRHFVSDRTDSPADPSGKYLEALTKLVTTIPSLGRGNHTPTCDEYSSLYYAQRSPGLGYAKKMALKHHFELMLRILSVAE
ncbi:sce7725 family protein [Sorangium sp. So ce1099]|uniref:sce7725 family protein n=1 Tax=Sorangium sp. So ce1099 TaxID=3133331 RepID=UPI003F6226D3